MKVLLDTHIFLWVLDDSPRLSEPARAFLRAANPVFVSAASIWELAVKHSIGKLRAEPAALAAMIGPSGFQELPVLSRHAARVATLPLHHKDPFDRLLVAQAIDEPLVLVSADSVLLQYSPLVHIV